jgi:enamine deaminase RidA (YjgF/YER057c/UK114 family)
MTGITRLESNARMSKVVIHCGIVYLSGQTSMGEEIEGVEGQTTEVLDRIDRLLDQNDSGRSHILSATIYLRNMSDFSSMNGVWEKWLPQNCAPARTTVQALLANDGLLVEITVIAAQKQ